MLKSKFLSFKGCVSFIEDRMQYVEGWVVPSKDYVSHIEGRQLPVESYLQCVNYQNQLSFVRTKHWLNTSYVSLVDVYMSPTKANGELFGHKQARLISYKLACLIVSTRLQVSLFYCFYLSIS